MHRPSPAAHWPESWRLSHGYDLQEVFGEVTNHGYAYAYRCRHDATLRLVARALPRGARILDVAAAQGNFSLSLAERGYNVTWNDIRRELEGYVRLKHDRGTISYAPGNAFDLDFPQLFDGVVITEIIEHVAHPDRFLRNTARLVQPGGVVVMTTPNGAYFRNTLPRFSECPDPSTYEAVQFKPNADGHIFLLHADEVRTLADDAGLTVEALEYLVNPLTIGHLGTRVLLPLLPRLIVEGAERVSRRLPTRVRERILVQMAVLFRRIR